MVLGIGLLHDPVSMEMLSGVSDLSLILVLSVGSNVVVVWVVCVVLWVGRRGDGCHPSVLHISERVEGGTGLSRVPESP